MDTDTRATNGRRSKRWVRGGAAAALLAGVALTLTSVGPAAGNGWNGKAVLHDVTGVKVGVVRFEGDEHGTVVKVAVKLEVGDSTPGLNAFHGLHLHANPGGAPCDPASSFATAGPHWSPSGATHGHHEGDLPSLLIQADGTATARSVTARFDLDPEQLDGRAVILHAGPDNFGNIPARYSTGTPPVAGPDAATLGTGDSGGRFACGIISID